MIDENDFKKQLQLIPCIWILTIKSHVPLSLAEIICFKILMYKDEKGEGLDNIRKWLINSGLTMVYNSFTI